MNILCSFALIKNKGEKALRETNKKFYSVSYNKDRNIHKLFLEGKCVIRDHIKSKQLQFPKDKESALYKGIMEEVSKFF